MAFFSGKLRHLVSFLVYFVLQMMCFTKRATTATVTLLIHKIFQVRRLDKSDKKYF